MVAAGFLICCLSVIWYKHRGIFYWTEHPKVETLLGYVFVFGILLVVVGTTVFLWRTLP